MKTIYVKSGKVRLSKVILGEVRMEKLSFHLDVMI